MEPIIEVKKISKKYKITHDQGGYIALRDVLMGIIKHPFKFIGSKAKEIAGVTKEDFWALKDISFDVMRGEAIGIIGSNGAGKSTLLKILSQITPPTEGEIIMRGKVGSLLEVGTGFHPELTGRENIFLNGAILGMPRKEIEKKFDKIVEFSGVEKFLDTPVKRYSSGMYVRLAFAVAAHMEPDILIVDEVLAVGDAEFQKKCLGKMDEVTKSEGRTVIFVSHNMNAIKQLCKRVVLLDHGEVKQIGDAKEIIDKYLKGQIDGEDTKINPITEFPKENMKAMQIRKVTVLNKYNDPDSEINLGDTFYIELDFDVNMPSYDVQISLLVSSVDNQRFMDSLESDYSKISLGKRDVGSYKTKIYMPDYLNAKFYRTMIVFESGQKTLDKKETSQFKIVDHEPHREYGLEGRAPVTPKLKWETTRII